MSELYLWEVFFLEEGSSLKEVLGTIWGTSEKDACNRARCRHWGKNVPYDHINGAIVAFRREDVRPIIRPSKKASQRQFSF